VKHRYGAVFALVGWQRLSPPFNPATEGYNPGAPLRQWKVWKTLDSQSACEQVLTDFYDRPALSRNRRGLHSRPVGAEQHPVDA
jgi:hypothetical protein